MIMYNYPTTNDQMKVINILTQMCENDWLNYSSTQSWIQKQFNKFHMISIKDVSENARQ